MDKVQKKLILQISERYNIPFEVAAAIVISPLEYLRTQTKDKRSMRVPHFGLFVAKSKKYEQSKEGFEESSGV
jgi:nucleoid DNA-binding protein